MNPVCLNCNGTGSIYTPFPELHSLNISQRIRRNDIPTTCRNSELLVPLRQAERELERWKAQIDKLKLSLTRMENQKREMEMEIIYAKSILAPIRQLPRETLESIFEFVCNRVELLDEELITPPLVLQRVCSHWNSIVSSHRHLWTEISFSLPQTHSYPHSSKVKFISALTRHAGKLPLSLQIDHVVIDHVIESVNINLERLATLDLACRYIRPKTVTLLRGHLPSLESLAIRGSSFPDTFIMLSDIFMNCTLLKTVSLQAVPCSLQLPWHQLTNMTFKGRAQPELVMRAISQCFQLEHLSLDSCWMADEDLSNLEPTHVTISTLISLRCTITNLQSLQWFTDMIPRIKPANLQSLSISYHPTTISLAGQPLHRDIWACMYQLITASLDSLTLEGIAIPLPEILPLVPALTALTLKSPSLDADIHPISNHLLSLMAHSGIASPFEAAIEPLVPKLTKLNLTVNGTSFCDGALVEMVRTRWEGCLQSLSLRLISRSLSEEAFWELRRLRGAKFAVQLEDMHGCLFTQKGVI